MKTNGTVYNIANHRIKHYKNRQASKECSLREKCTTNKNGRFIERSIYQEALEQNQKRVNDHPDYYCLRQQITEHYFDKLSTSQFGTLKRQWGFTFTLMKGKENVLSEVNLMMMVYNLRRLMSIFDINTLKRRIEEVFLDFCGYLKLF